MGRSLLVVVLLAACSPGDPIVETPPPAMPDPDPDPLPDVPTFHRDVEPILQDACQACHAAGGIGPFALVSYDDARAVAPLLVAETEARRMPPWGAQESAACQPPLGWQDDQRLTDEQIAT